MISRRLISLFLLVTLILPAFAQTNSPTDNDSNEEQKLTDAEQKEVRMLVSRFVSRFEETGDVMPLFSEFFIADFGQHREQHPETLLPFALICKRTAKEATPSEWKCFYASAINFWIWGTKLYRSKSNQSLQQKDDDDEELLPLETIFPPELVSLMRSNDLLKQFLREEGDEDDECNTFSCDCPPDNEVVSQDKGINIKSPARLNNLAEILGKAATLARKAFEQSQREKKRQRSLEKNDKEEWFEPTSATEDVDFFGYAAETPLFCYHAFDLHIDMVRENGKLKILALGLYFND